MKCSRLLLSVLFAYALTAHSAWAAPTPISTCKRLTVPGPYVLTNNITASAAAMTATWASGFVGCIVMAADNITLDMAGYVVTGTGTSTSTFGIAQGSVTRKGDVVRSGSVRNFRYGVAFAGSGHTIQSINASNNGNTGIYVSAAGNRIIGNTANNNASVGISSVQCPNLLLENMASGNPNSILDQGTCDVRQENVPAP
jgi:hypothetical protein